MFVYIIIPTIIINVQKILLHTGGGCLAARQKTTDLALPVSIKQFPWQPDNQ